MHTLKAQLAKSLTLPKGSVVIFRVMDRQILFNALVLGCLKVDLRKKISLHQLNQ